MRLSKVGFLKIYACSTGQNSSSLYRFTKSAHEPTGCATRLQQAGYVVRSGFTSDLAHIACLLEMLEKFRFSAETMDATKNGPEPLCLRGPSCCASRGQSHLSGKAQPGMCQVTKREVEVVYVLLAQQS